MRRLDLLSISNGRRTGLFYLRGAYFAEDRELLRSGLRNLKVRDSMKLQLSGFVAN
jgi:hypothetical protein